MESYEIFEGVLVPYRGIVSWGFEDEDFEYFKFEIMDYNIIK